MATGKTIKIMISSRCTDKIAYKGSDEDYSVIRVDAAKSIGNHLGIHGKKLFRCWINENESSTSAAQDSEEVCLKQARESDVFLSVYNGNAGWVLGAGGIGICHAELQEAMRCNPEKVRLIQEDSNAFKLRTRGKNARNADKLMYEYVQQLSLFRDSYKTGEELVEASKSAIADYLVESAKASSLAARSVRRDLGQALQWNRLSLAERSQAMRAAVIESIENQRGSKVVGGKCFVSIDTYKILILCHAVPGSLGVSAAREIVGMPFLDDYKQAAQLKGRVIGPVHMVACHKGISESQAMRMLGFPDAAFVETSYGIYVADKVQQIQLMLLKNCCDIPSTRQATRRAFDWLRKSGELEFLIKRAIGRKNIAIAISKEQ